MGGMNQSPKQIYFGDSCRIQDASFKSNTDETNLMDMNQSLITRLREFLEVEARSCSMDFGRVTAEYVHRMWGGTVTIEEIRPALRACLKEFYGR